MLPLVHVKRSVLPGDDVPGLYAAYSINRCRLSLDTRELRIRCA